MAVPRGPVVPVHGTFLARKVYHGVEAHIREGGAGALQEDAEGAQQMHMHHGLWVA